MNPDERLERLEQRLAVLEDVVRQLTPLLGRAGPPSPEAVSRPSPSGTGAPAPAAARPPRPPEARSPAAEPAAGAVGSARVRSQVAPMDREQWYGQRGLLAVGVVFLILAAGYLLKLSFDRGWISPFVRCLGGALAGGVVGALGWRLSAKGLRTYGASLIGCGAAIIYLAVWAASRLYHFLPPASGITGLALVSLALAAIAFAIDVEALGATAALGAFFAPILLGGARANADTLLWYLGFMGAALGWVSAHRRWRLAMLVVALGYFGMATTGALEQADTYRVLVYGLFGGCAGLYVGLREGWWETRLLAFGGGWGTLGVANQHMPSHLPTLIGAVILAAPVWWRGLRSATIWPGSAGAPSASWSLGETLYFYITPVLLGWAVQEVSPATFDRHGGLAAFLVALPYLLAGFMAERRAFAVTGTTAVLVAVVSQWRGLEATWALLALAHLWAAADHVLRRSDGRWYAAGAAGAALIHLFDTDLSARASGEPAFVGPWALTLWWAVETCAALAAGLWRRVEEEPRAPGRRLPAVGWGVAGLLLLFGVTGELNRYFTQGDLPGTTAELASGLAISAWWIVFAAGLVLLGFRRGIKPVRVAGLVVSGLAVAKVVAFDLSSLDALYRVGSVFILGLVSLGLAYLYHRRARGPADAGEVP